LHDNPARSEAEPVPRGLQPNAPYSRQRHVYSKNHPLIPTQLLQPLRTLADRYGCVLLGELSGEGQLERVRTFTQGEQLLHFAYSFDLLNTELTPGALRGLIEELEGGLEDGWPCWSFGNHDVARAVSRLGGPLADPALARLLPVLLTSLRGSFCLYQGEELGLPEAELAFEDLLDPPGIAFWPDYKGRDGCRTPMPWAADRPHGGFSEAKPWLPVPAGHLDLAVDHQERDSGSTLHAVRRFLHWRRSQPELRLGSIDFVDAPAPILAFERRAGERALLLAFNLGPEPVVWEQPPATRPLEGHGLEGSFQDGRIHLTGYAGYVGRLR
jgi:alpha-glucosidase